MDTMNARLKFARVAAGFRSARSAATKFGWGVSTYAAHENGQNDYDPDTAATYAKSFKTSAAWLLTAHGDMPRGLSEDEPRRSLVSSYDPDAPDEIEIADEAPREGQDIRARAPEDAVFELVAQGGLGTGHTINTLAGGAGLTVDEVKEDYWRFPSSFVRGILDTKPADMVVIECSGDSMEPTLRSGDRVYVNGAHRTPSPDGLYAIRDAFGAIIIKRVEIAQDRPIRLRIISDNPNHHPREVDEHDITIVGKVVAGMKLF